MNQANNQNLKVAILGASLATGNMGVSALAASIINLVFKINPSAEISLFIGNRSSKPQSILVNEKTVNINVVNYRYSLKSRFDKHILWILFLALMQSIIPIRSLRLKIIESNSWLRGLYNSNLIGEIRGGDSFSDIYGLIRFLRGIIPIYITILLKKEFVLLPQTYGPYKSPISKKIAYLILKKSKAIYARDNISLNLVNTMLSRDNSINKIKFCPDVAFTLNAAEPDQIDIVPQLNQRENRVLIGLNVNGLVYNGGYSHANMFNLKLDYKIFVQELINMMLKQDNCAILLVPHTFTKPGDVNSDLDACRLLYRVNSSIYKDCIHLVNKKYNQSEIKRIIKLCDFFVGTRMHACIAALSQGIPTVGVAYSRKFIGVFDSVGLGDWVVDAREVDIQTSLNYIMLKYQQCKDCSESIKTTVEEAKVMISRSFQEIFTNITDSVQ